MEQLLTKFPNLGVKSDRREPQCVYIKNYYIKNQLDLFATNLKYQVRFLSFYKDDPEVNSIFSKDAIYQQICYHLCPDWSNSFNLTNREKIVILKILLVLVKSSTYSCDKVFWADKFFDFLVTSRYPIKDDPRIYSIAQAKLLELVGSKLEKAPFYYRSLFPSDISKKHNLENYEEIEY